jgi:hypothetical protein
MNIAYKYSITSLTFLALANWSLCFQTPCRGAEQTPADLAERIRVLGAEDPGLPPIDQAHAFSSSIASEAANAGLTLMRTTRVESRTNASLIELRQNLVVEATEPQILEFLRNLAASNSTLRAQSLSLHPTPDRSRLQASIAITGDYRLPATGQSQGPAAAQVEYLVLSQRRQLRQAALDCHKLTKSTLPPGWNLDNFSFADGQRLIMQGDAPADQVRLLPEVQAKFEKAQAQDGKPLFRPASGDATMRMIEPGRTNFAWSMHFELRPIESH